MNNKIEVLKLDYEHLRSFTIMLFTITIAIIFGVISNSEKLSNSRSIVIWSVVSILAFIAFVIYFVFMERKYTELKANLKLKQ